MKKRNSHPNKKRGSGIKGLFKSSCIGSLVGLVSFLALTLVISALSLLFDDPLRLAAPMCIFALYASAFFAGIFSPKRSDFSPLICGAVCGAFLTLAFFLISFISSPSLDTSGSSFSPILKLLLIPCSCLGAIVGGASPKKGKNRQKRRQKSSVFVKNY